MKIFKSQKYVNDVINILNLCVMFSYQLNCTPFYTRKVIHKVPFLYSL